MSAYDDYAAGHEEEFDLYCQPCTLRGFHHEAFGYCTVCEQHMCQKCYKYHPSIASCKHHRLLDKARMPKSMKIKDEDDSCTEFCTTHKREIIKFFCKPDKALCCSVGQATIHNKTKCDVCYIPDIVERITTSQELTDMKYHINQLNGGFKENLATVTTNNNEITKLKTDAKASILASKTEIIKILGQFENDLNTCVDSVSNDDIKKMSEISQSCTALNADLQGISAELEDNIKKKQSYKLFVAMERGKEKLATMTEKLASISCENRIHGYKYQAKSKLQQMYTMGQLLVGKIGHHISDIKTEGAGHITGLALLDDSHIVICQHSNKTVQLIDLSGNKVQSKLTLQHSPWDITVLPNNELLVSLPEPGKLHYLTMENMKLGDTDRDIDVSDQCIAVKFFNEKLVVSFLEPDRVAILDLSGELLLTFPTEFEGDTLFDGPMAIAVSQSKGIIHVANYWGHKVTSLTVNGDDLASLDVFSHEDLGHPAGVTCDKEGNVYVTSQEPSQVLQLSGEGNQKVHFSVFQSDLSDTKPPAAILHLGSTDQLLVSHWNTGLIRVLGFK